ncbi:MAG: 6-phosphogluconolactonase [Planctomycetaceae bacterium]|nr:6-phosphogluconolactonase [Planctomycetaceae bacterium]
MTGWLIRSLFLVIVGSMGSFLMRSAGAGDLLVFVTAFAAGDEGAICAYQLDPDTGQLELVERSSDVEHPFFIALSPDRKFLYSIHAPGQFGGKDHEQVAAFQIANSRGQLKLLNRQSARGTAACYLDVDHTGKTVVVANYSSGSVASLPVRPDGSLGEAASFIQHRGSSVNPARQQAPHAHSIIVSPDNRFVFAADLGLDQVLGYRLDDSAATLVANRQPFVRTPPGAGPRHLTFDPSGKHLYAINEIHNSVTLFDYDEKSGVLIEQQTISTLPEDFDGVSHCADLKITPDGRYLYGTNRGHDSIAAYRIGEGGRLTRLAIEPSRGKGPQNLAITPGGELLLCANMSGANLSLFRIDSKTGGLTPVGEPLEQTGPSCILIR